MAGAFKAVTTGLSIASKLLGIGEFFGLDQALGLKGDNGLQEINGKLSDILNISKDILSVSEQTQADVILGQLSTFKTQMADSLQYMLSYQTQINTTGVVDTHALNLALDDSQSALNGIISYISSVPASPVVLAPVLLAALAVREQVIWELGDGAFSADYKQQLDNAHQVLLDLRPHMVDAYLSDINITITHQDLSKSGLFFDYTLSITSANDPSYIQELKLYNQFPGTVEDAVDSFTKSRNFSEFFNFWKSADPSFSLPDSLFLGDSNPDPAIPIFNHFQTDASNLKAWPDYDATIAKLEGLTSGDHQTGDHGGAPLDDALQARSDSSYTVLEGLRGNDTLTGAYRTDLLRGGDGNDTLMGNAGDDILIGGAGDDVLLGGLGNDRLDGGDGIDTASFADLGREGIAPGVTVSLDIRGSQNTQQGTDVLLNIENVSGSPFNDTLTGSSGANVVSGGGGDDTLRGLAGNDTLDGGSGTNTLDGGAGDDTYVLHAGSSDTVIEATDGGVDTVKADFSYTLGTGLENLTLLSASNLNGTGNELDNVMTGNAGSNTLLGMAGNDTLYGGDGNDTLDGGTGADTMTGGAGDDTYKVDNAADRIVELASGGTDAVVATISYKLGNFVEVLTLSGTDNLKGTGNALDNTIYGNAGNNVLVGNAGDDSLYGGDGKDTLNGGDGADTLIGGAGNDTLNGGAGPDVLDGGAGADKMTGWAGNDVYLVDNAHDKTIESADGGTDTVQASINWTLAAQVEKLTLIGGNLNGSGNASDNTITGTLGNNVLKGNAGADIIFGNDGSDKLFGGDGKDTLTGGTGKDIFVFDTAASVANADNITDFSRAEGDKIQLSEGVFAGFSHLGSLTADEFYAAAGAKTAHDASDRLIYNTTTGDLYYDADGSGAKAAAILVAHLTGHPELAYGDIQIIA